jgi:magnesium chelatase subunit I
VELVYEGELEGASGVAQMLIGKAIRTQFEQVFPNPEKTKKSKKPNPYARILGWFNEGNTLPLLHTDSQIGYENMLKQVDGLAELVKTYMPKASKQESYLWMEFVLHGLAEFSQLSKNGLERGLEFKDLMSGMFDMKQREADENDFGGYYEEK